jgi:hypothetical protein
MLFLISVFLFPIFFLILCFGTGLLLQNKNGRDLNLTISIAEGFALIISIGYLLTIYSSTAKYLSLVILALTILGIFLNMSILSKLIRQTNNLLIIGFTYLFTTLPLIIYGKVTWSGWVQLDDTATFLAITDRIMKAGQTLTSTLISTYDRVIHVVLGNSFFGSYSAGTNQQSFRYPIGSLIPIGTSGKLLGIDIAWIYFPYLLLCIAITAGLFSVIFAKYLSKKWQINLASFISAQASTIYSYALWGGIKELTIVPVLLLHVILLDKLFVSKKKHFFRSIYFLRYLLSAISFYAIAGKTGIGFIAGSVAIYLAIQWLPSAVKNSYFQILFFLSIGIVVIFHSQIVEFINRVLVPEIPDSGNFSRPLNPFQILGIWPSGDFRSDLYWQPYSQIFILMALAIGLFGITESIKSKNLLMPTLVFISTFIVIYSNFYGGIWLTGKSLAVASPFWLSAIFIGVNHFGQIKLLFRIRTQTLVAVSAAVLISNYLSVTHAWFAPSEKIQELARIGKTFDGQGPALMTDYSVAGARYFLRNLSTESASELRVNAIPLRDGSQLQKGFAADIDLFDNKEISRYPLLVLKHTAVGSRPLFNYDLVFTGKFYDVWKRNSTSAIQSIGLGNNLNPSQKPDCEQVQSLFNSKVSAIYAPIRKNTYVVSFSDSKLPISWKVSADKNGSVLPVNNGVIQKIFEVSEEGKFELFIGGSYAATLSVQIDGKEIYSGNTFFEGNQYLSNYLASAQLTKGKHLLQVTYKKRFWLPGNNVIAPLGPLYLTQQTAADSEVSIFSAADAAKLCSSNVDWLAWKVA